MPDLIDAAQALDLERNELVQQAARLVAVEMGPLDCLTCGEPIPQARRLAAVGCTNCIDCAELAQRRARTSRPR